MNWFIKTERFTKKTLALSLQEREKNIEKHKDWIIKLNKSGVKLSDFVGGNPGFSGSHDATIKLVESGTYEAGALNEQVWKARLLEGKTNPSKVKVIWRTPPYHDYHWLARPDLNKRFGNGFTSRLRKILISFSKENPRQKIILEAFGAEKFITSENKNYIEIEKIGREIGKIK